MSLRLRLALIAVALAAAALLISDVVTYTSLRSFLVRRVDQQLVTAVSAARFTFGLSEAAPVAPPSDDDDHDQVVRPPATLTPGTYAELRGADGRVLDSVEFSYGEEADHAPALPEYLTAASLGDEQRANLTVGAEGDSSLHYRVLVSPQGGDGQSIVVAIPLTEVQDILNRLLLVHVLLGVGVLAGLAGLSWWMVRRGLRPLESMSKTAAGIAAGDLSRRVEVGNPKTEVGRLGLALNAMLVQIEEAFAQRLASEQRLRRFLADASHELRTPLTSIRGYAELFRRGASQNQQDLSTSMRRIEQESRRMGSLVEDMLLLARLDRDRPLDLAAVDLALVARDAVQDARAADPSRDISASLAEEVLIRGDKDRLCQVAANLLNNALVHTPPGTPVEVTVLQEKDQGVLEVADRGPGIAAEDAERVFEPFYRTDSGRSRERGGAGLGLSIVAAIAAAHGGSARVLSRPGGGSVFRVELPLAGGRYDLSGALAPSIDTSSP